MKKSKAGVPLGKPRGWKRGDGPYTLYRRRLEVMAEAGNEEKVVEKAEEKLSETVFFAAEIADGTITDLYMPKR